MEKDYQKQIVGARKEMLVAAWFLERGWRTYRACGNFMPDLIVISPTGQRLLVEVKSGNRPPFAPPMLSKTSDVDAVAYVTKDGVITWYFPLFDGPEEK